MKTGMLTAAIAAALPIFAAAQQQVKAPIAVYWISVETAGGMGMGLPPAMAGMMPPGMTGGRRMKLDLGSARDC